MQILVVDANFLMSAYRFKVDAINGLNELLPAGYQLLAPSSVMQELEGLSRNKSPSGKGATYALEILKREGVKVIKTEKSADDWIVDYCSSNGAIACTNDSALRKRLRENKVKSIVLKGRARIDYA
ncbi:MAG: hypothetical protein V1909_06470 [Candidatus Micrarchaeota archaeon]